MNAFDTYMRKQAGPGGFHANNPTAQMTGGGGNPMLSKDKKKPLDPWAHLNATGEDPEEHSDDTAVPKSSEKDVKGEGTVFGGVIG